MAEQLIMPKLGFDMAEGTLIDWNITVGDKINKGDVIAEIETDKATIEIEAQVSGVVLKLLAGPGDIVAVGAPMAYVGEEGEAIPEEGVAPVTEAPAAPVEAVEEKAKVTPVPAVKAAPAPANGVKASPVARRMAEERGLDLRQIKGSGPGGRIVKKDVENFLIGEAPATPGEVSAPTPTVAPPPAAFATPTFGEFPSGPDVEEVELSRLRIRIGSRMVESKQYAPHFYITTEVDVAAALELRQQLNASITDPAHKISVNDLIVKAAALTLREYPNLNSHYYGDRLARHKRINIGIATALPGGGLLNVVARDADKTALGTLAAQNRDMITRARDGKVKPHEIEGGTFTVSNLGPYGIENFIAIINPPEAAILSVGAARKVPVILEDGSVGVGMRMKATISVDHRVSDGAEAAEFLEAFKGLIEQPIRLLI
jgi:pyruvate dehydrogenase E2 component (dihydrolipoamide acetyltransferase)